MLYRALQIAILSLPPRQALCGFALVGAVSFCKRKNADSDHLAHPMATLLSAHLAQRSEKMLGTGHGRGRPQELLSPFGVVAPEPASGMMVTGTMSGIHERQDHSECSWSPSSS